MSSDQIRTNGHARLVTLRYSSVGVELAPTKVSHVKRTSARRKRDPETSPIESSMYSEQSHTLKMAEAVGAHRQKQKKRTKGSVFTNAIFQTLRLSLTCSGTSAAASNCTTLQIKLKTATRTIRKSGPLARRSKRL